MSLFKRGDVWWFKFKFSGRVIRESTKSSSKDVARRAELQRRREVEESYNHLRRREPPITFAAAAKDWVEEREVSWAAKTKKIELTNIGHLKPVFAAKLCRDRPGGHRQVSEDADRRGRIPKDGEPRSRNAAGDSETPSAVGEPPARREDAADDR